MRLHTTGKLPPSQFSNAMNDIKGECKLEGWRETDEWKLFVAGYNAAVEVANSQPLLDIHNTTEQVCAPTVPDGTSERTYGPQGNT